MWRKYPSEVQFAETSAAAGFEGKNANLDLLTISGVRGAEPHGGVWAAPTTIAMCAFLRGWLPRSMGVLLIVGVFAFQAEPFGSPFAAAHPRTAGGRGSRWAACPQSIGCVSAARRRALPPACAPVRRRCLSRSQFAATARQQLFAGPTQAHGQG